MSFLFGPSKHVLRVAAQCNDLRKDLSNLEKDVEHKEEKNDKKHESSQFEVDSGKKKLEQAIGILQSHVKAVNPRLDTIDQSHTELQDRVKRIEKDIIKKATKNKGGVDLTDIVEEHDAKIEQLVAIVQHDILAKMIPMEKKITEVATNSEKLVLEMAQAKTDIEKCMDAAEESRNMVTEFGIIKQDLETRMTHIQEDTLNLRYDYDLILHTNTRQVNWKIDDARQKITEMFLRCCSVWSPPFTVATFPVMYIQLRVTTDSQCLPGSSSAARQAQNLTSALPTQGNLAVTIWTQPGIETLFRLCIGAVTKKFRAIFERDDNAPDQQLVGCTLTNFAPLDPSWNRASDTIHVGLEIMEAELAGTVKLEAIQPKVLTDFPSLNDNQVAEVQFKRHIVSHTHMLEQVDRKLQNLKQRWVRRVEWQIRQVVNIVSKAQVNDVIESPGFSAGGLTELKFVFYPKGIDPKNPTWCGLYLRCAEENVFVKFQLSVGKAVKTFEHFFASRGEVFGKTKYCHLETQIENKADPELSVLNVSVEVLEVSHRKRDTENVLLFHRDDTYAKEEYRVLTLPPRTVRGS